MKRQLTILQRGVIQRLRDAHYDDVAEAAHGAWTRAEAYQLATPIREPELMADYQKANAQLVTGLTDRRLAR